MFFKKKQKTSSDTFTVKTSKNSTYKKQSISNELNENGEIPFGWIAYNYNSFKDFEEELVHYSSILELTDIDEKIVQLQNLINIYHNFKAHCYAESPCHKKHFQNTWEHCSNSQKPDFEFVENIKESLEYLQNNYTQLITTQKLLAEHLPTLPRKVFQIISDNSGIIQSDIYKLFPAQLKNSISEFIYNQAKLGNITREKVGRSFKLSIK